MGVWRATVKDARGRAVPLVRHETLLPGITDPARRQRLMQAHAGGGKLSRAEIRRASLWFVATFPLAAAPAVLAPLLTKVDRWWPFLLILPNAFVPALISIFIMRRSVPQRIARAYTTADLCASCGYDLKGIQPAPDACRVCPECGAAWRAEPPAAHS